MKFFGTDAISTRIRDLAGTKTITPEIISHINSYTKNNIDVFLNKNNKKDINAIFSPLGIWLLVALVAPLVAEEESHTVELSELLGMPLSQAHATAIDIILMTTEHNEFFAGVALWYQENYVDINTIMSYRKKLPKNDKINFRTTPSQKYADSWARTTSREILDSFPIEINGTGDAPIAICLSNLIGCELQWKTSLEKSHDTNILLPNGWQNNTRPAPDCVLKDSTVGKDNENSSYGFYRTKPAGVVFAHSIESQDDFKVYSIIAENDTTLMNAVLCGGIDIINGVAQPISPSFFKRKTSDLSWTVQENGKQKNDFEVYLPFWEATQEDNNYKELEDETSLGLPLIAEGFKSLVKPELRAGSEITCGQVAKAEYTDSGFKAAALSYAALRLGSVMTLSEPPPTNGCRTTIIYDRPYAVIVTKQHGRNELIMFAGVVNVPGKEIL